LAADPIQRDIGRGVAWVGLASALVALCDIAALAVILKLWVSRHEFGLVSVVVTLFGALQLVGEAGLPAAVVGRDEPDDDRLSTMYWVGLAIGAALYAVVWFAAPLVASLHGDPVIASLFRVVGLVVLIRPLYTTHGGVMRRALGFRRISALRMVANVVELVAKVGSAAAGAGLWCFAFGPLARELVYAIGYSALSRWHPRLTCQPRRIVDDFRFGMRSTGGELVFQLYSNFDYQVVSYVFGAAALGIYRAAYELVLEPVRFVSNVVTVVAFPAFARLRDNRAAVLDQLVRFARQNLIVVLLLVAVVLAASEEVLLVVLGPGYASAATAARILALVGVLRALSHLGPPLLDGLGRPDLTLRYQLTAAVVLATSFIAFAELGSSFRAVAVAWAVGYPLAFAYLASLALAQLGVTAGALLRPLARIALAIAGAAVAGVALRAAALAMGWPPGARLAVTATGVLVSAFVLLYLLEGLSPRSIIATLRQRSQP
jgi:O-antigen/teichoic acid export membrane protein